MTLFITNVHGELVLGGQLYADMSKERPNVGMSIFGQIRHPDMFYTTRKTLKCALSYRYTVNKYINYINHYPVTIKI